MLRVGIVANERSGDLLGASLIQALRERVPDISFEGVGGPLMIEQGCTSLFPLERLSVMGLVEVLRHLPELLAIRRSLARHFLENPPDVFIGIDAPDFNLGLETRLRRAGIPTVHYVSPSVWAWRPRRVRKIRAAVDLLLSILPFEQGFLQAHQVPVCYVGHPLADQIPLENDQAAARRSLGLEADTPVVAILPGSRMSEVSTLAEPFLRTAAWCLQRRPALRFVTPLVNTAVRQAFEAELRAIAPQLPIRLLDGQAREAMLAADVVLVASGTATLEALLLKRPMVVGYRLHWLSYQILKRLRMLKIPHIALANLLADERLAPEFIQHECNPQQLGEALLALLDDPARRAAIAERYGCIHRELRHDASHLAAEAVLGLIRPDQTAE